MTEKKAYHRVILPDGRILAPGVVSRDSQGRVVEVHPLQGEEPFTQWVGGDCLVEE